ncbi:MAG TPA: sigma-54 dependent transcriptional regulator [Hyphomicrobiales bacterium]|nr:sigma-54 dependent transcriptional regulator [Hyphomicrobiales bacterium]
MKSQKSILLCTASDSLQQSLRAILQSAHYAVLDSATLEQADILTATRNVSVLIGDLGLEEATDFAFIARLRARKPALPIVLACRYAQIPDAVRGIQAGANDYVTIPCDPRTLIEICNRLTSGEDGQPPMVMADPLSVQTAALAKRVAQSNATVMICGESGTGKEVFSRYIHENSPRAGKPFVAINCAAIPETMLESILFGYEKGAFTGAVTARPGKFEQANGGTLLLDEISEMDLGLQAKLLRVIQEREVERLGGSRSIVLDLRIIATTNRNLKEAVKAGRFREDLFYRLNVFPLHLPGLRHRQEDIVPLAYTFIERYRGEHSLTLDEAAGTRLIAHDWPGNVRELENVIQRALILTTGTTIEESAIVFETVDSAFMAPIEASLAARALESDLKTLEQELILDAIGNQRSRKAAAEKLGISPRTLRYKLAQFRKAGIALPA